MLTILRPLSTSELLDRTFHLYKNNFVVFFSIVAIPQLLVLATQLLYAKFALSSHPSTPSLLASLPISWLSLLCLSISEGATVIAVSELHLGRKTGISSAFRGMQGSIWRVTWISLAISWIVGFGLILLIIPGILWALEYSLAVPVTVLEKTDLRITKLRSGELTKGSRGRVFVIYALLSFLGWAVGAGLDFAFDSSVPWHPQATITGTKFVFEVVSGFLTSSVVGPLLTIALTLLYYDERVRKEGFDLQFMMSTLDGAGPTAAAAPAS